MVHSNKTTLHAYPAFNADSITRYIRHFRETTYVVQDTRSGHIGISIEGDGVINPQSGVPLDDSLLLLGRLPPLYPEWLGDRAFNETYQTRFAYVAGEMAQGISSEQMVISMAKAGMLGVFGAGGLPIDRIEQAIVTIKQALTGHSTRWAVNLIHSPQEPYLEEQAVDLFLKHKVDCVSASAFMRLEKSIVRYVCQGLTRDAHGNLQRQHQLLAKVSRPEVAMQFMSPAPAAILDVLLSEGRISKLQAELAGQTPVADDITVEADSGGHTDNRPLSVLLPTILQLRNELQQQHAYEQTIRVGAAGGLGTPDAVAAAFAMGAAYVVTGSINQSCLEAAQSAAVKQLLCEQDLADVIMAPAADMFEMGVKLQVARRGSLFAQRALQLYDWYRRYSSIEQLSDTERLILERDIFRMPIEQVWQQTQAFWQQRHPQEIERANHDAKHRMALLFRWYLGKATQWAQQGDESRRLDYQVWCGPAMGAFNRWVRNSFMATAKNRNVINIALNLLEGAAYFTRAHQLRSYGVPVPASAFTYQPQPLQLHLT